MDEVEQHGLDLCLVLFLLLWVVELLGLSLRAAEALVLLDLQLGVEEDPYHRLKVVQADLLLELV